MTGVTPSKAVSGPQLFKISRFATAGYYSKACVTVSNNIVNNR